jgi:hypothetical protein
MENRQRRFHPDFAKDLLNAAKYYDEISTAIGARFRTEVQSRIDLIATTPEGFACIHKNIRAVRAPKFPYIVLYRVNGDLVEYIGLVFGWTQRKHWFDRGS